MPLEDEGGVTVPHQLFELALADTVGQLLAGGLLPAGVEGPEGPLACLLSHNY